MPQPEDGYSWRQGGIICSRQSKNITQYLCAFQKLFLGGGKEDDKVGAIFNLFSVDNLKYLLIPEINNPLIHPMDPGEFIRRLGC